MFRNFAYIFLYCNTVYKYININSSQLYIVLIGPKVKVKLYDVRGQV